MPNSTDYLRQVQLLLGSPRRKLALAPRRFRGSVQVHLVRQHGSDATSADAGSTDDTSQVVTGNWIDSTEESRCVLRRP